MDYQLFKLTDEQREMLSAMDVITKDDVQELFESFSPGKIKKVRVGKLRIDNVFYPRLKDSGLPEHEGKYAFYAIEKHSLSFFWVSYRIFIWPLGSHTVYAVEVGSVIFETPDKDTRVSVLLKEQPLNKLLFKTEEYGREHECIIEKMCLHREFALEKKKITCTKDHLSYHYRWTNPDGWVREHFEIAREYEPMHFLRNEPVVLRGGVELTYPRRPDLWGHHIDEN